MKNNLLFKVITFVMAICIIVTGFIFNDYLPIEANASETQGNTHYALFTGSYHIWSNSAGIWQSMGEPGQEKYVNSNFNIVPGARNIKVYPYNPYATDDTAFDFNNSTRYKWNSTPMASDKGTYFENYWSRGAIIDSVNDNSLNYNFATGELNISYKITLTANDIMLGPIDIKDMLSQPGGKQDFVDYVGYVDSTLENVMNLLDPFGNEYSPNVRGYMYFIPMVVQYDLAPENNLEMLSVEFIDSSGSVVTEPFANKSYKARYNVKYTGEDMESYVDVYLQNMHIRNRKAGNTYYDYIYEVSKSVKLKNNDTFYIDVGPFNITQPSIYANGTIKPDPLWNTDDADDYGEKEIIGIVENLTLTIESINPPITKVYSPQTEIVQDYEIVYTVNYVSAENADIVTDLVLTIPTNSYTNPNSLNITRYIQLSPGLNRLTINTGPLEVRNANGSFNAILEVNKSRLYPSYELTYVDNKDTVIQDIQSIPQDINPCIGEINRENPSWEVTYNVATATGYWLEVGYHGWHSGACNERDDETGRCIDRDPPYECTCSRCVGGSVDYWTQTSTRTEEFEIKDIYFTSKDSGTVDLLNRAGKIKAGYGFELEIIAKYTGTESPSRPATWGGCNYQSVSPGPYVLNSLPNDIYVILPDGQIISNKTSVGIKNMMDCVVTNSGNLSRTLRCQVDLDNTFGNKETRKIYVDENTKDGVYDITVCTAKFNGVSPYATKPFFDRQKVKFEVKGKYTDDVTTHIVQ